MANAEETYEIKTSDKELHVINLMLEALDRHLGVKDTEFLTDDIIERRMVAMHRCATYVLSRIETM